MSKTPGMSLKMFTMTADKPPEIWQVSLDGAADEARLVGPGMQGHIYRSASRQYYYRRMPLRADLMGWYASFEEQTKRLRQADHDGSISAAVLIPDRQMQQADGSWMMRYPVSPQASSLATALKGRARERLPVAVSAIRGIENWWALAGCPLFPMPAEIVTDGDSP